MHPDSGCCGMAGAFGFEPDKYELSMRVGERVLLPAVRSAARDTLIVADGFSCREQIAQTTERRGLHLAQVLQMALREGPSGPRGKFPEKGYVESRGLVPLRALVMPIVASLSVGLLVAALIGRNREEEK